MKKDITILIPALNPDKKMVTLISNLIKNNFTNIIVVNDGSNKEHLDFFKQIEKHATILTHAINLGKGRALKTGFNYYLNNNSDCIGVITVDADGQHQIEDINKIYLKLKENPDNLILGARTFNQKNVPFRSKFGNIITKKLFNFLTGLKIQDTQTGLRAIPNVYLEKLLSIDGERFDFEMNMLMYTKQENITVLEENIETIYLEENKSSHFNPFTDSLKIYTIFLKYIFSSMLAFIVDILFYKIFFNIFIKTLTIYTVSISTILARIISSIVNYKINKNIVFNKANKFSLIKYYTLCLIQMCISALLVSLIYNNINNHEVLIKVIVDTIIFFINYKIQQEWVFKDPI